jgi:hypothetical protein
MTGTMTHNIPHVSQITISPACSLGRELLVYEPEDLPEKRPKTVTEANAAGNSFPGPAGFMMSRRCRAKKGGCCVFLV